MACQIKYNDNYTMSISAPNGAESILYQNLRTLPEITDDYQAMNIWLKAYTKSFKEWFGDWESFSETEKNKLISQGYLDKNGEPALFYKSEWTGAEMFNYADSSLSQGAYVIGNVVHAFKRAEATEKTILPVFLKPGKSINFKNIAEFKAAAAKFSKIETDPTDAQIKVYVESLHGDGTTIIGKSSMGIEVNVPAKNNVKSILSKELEFPMGVSFDNSDYTQFMTEDFQESRNSDKFIEELIFRLGKNIGMDTSDIEMITKDDAALITRNTKNPWSGQAAFFLNGKVYFVKNKLRYDVAFHEFAHPLIKGLAKDNSTLFNRIYNDLIAEKQGKEFLAEAITEYPELDPNHIQIQEEVIVKAMTYAAQNEGMLDQNLQPSKGIVAAIKKLLYAIKQMLRKLSSRPTFKGLSPTTTVNDLAGMLMDETWNVDLSVTTQDDIVAYISDLNTHMNEMREAAQSEEGRAGVYQQLLENSRITRTQIRNMKANDQYEDLAIVLADPTGRIDVIQMQANMTRSLDTRAKIARAATERIDETIEFDKRIEALSLNLQLIDDSILKMKTHIKSLVDEPNQKSAMRQMSYYVESMEQWDLYLDKFLEFANEVDIDSDAELVKDINTIKTNINRTKADVNEVYKSSLSETLTEVMEGTNDNITKLKDKEIAEFKKKLDKISDQESSAAKVLKKRIEETEESKKSLVVDKDKMLDYLTGKMGDIGWLHSNFENFISNQDPSISSFAFYLKQNMSNVDSKVHNKYSEFVNTLEPMLKELGIAPSQIDKFADTFLFIDKGYKRNKEGVIEEYPINTFLNEYQNYKFTLAKINEAVNEADIAWTATPDKENTERLTKLQNIKDEHTKYFFRKKYVDEYYNADSILSKSEAGIEAKNDIDVILSDIRTYQAVNPESSEIYEDYEIIDQLWKDYKQQFSTYDNYGQKKTGIDLEKAELLQAWRDGKRDFHEMNIIPGAFEGTLKNLEMKLVVKLQDEGYIEETEDFDNEFKRRKDLWLDRNTQVKIKDSFYAARDQITGRIQEIMAQVPSEVNFDEEWETILDSLQGRRDEDGQPVGTEMTEEHLSSIKDIEQLMEAAKQDIAGIGGLSPNEQEDMNFLFDKMNAGERLNPDELKEFRELKAKKSKVGLAKSLKTELTALFKALDDLQQRVPTDYYIDIVNEFYEDIQKESGQERPEEITNENIAMFSDMEYVNKLFEKSEKFKEWFLNNHIIRTRFDKELGARSSQYQRIYAWSVIKPNNPNYLEKTDILDENGEVQETIPGIPTAKFSKRSVKDKFHTGYDPKTGEIDDSSYRDSQGNQLPKNLEEMKLIRDTYQDELADLNNELEEILGNKITWDHYLNNKYAELKAKNNIEFKVLETLKKFHIDSQDGLARNATLGNELPRFRKDRHEFLTSNTVDGTVLNKLNSWGKAIGQTFGRRSDDYEEGLNFDEQMAFVNTDIYGGSEQKIPIKGTYLLEENQVSRNITTSMFQYYQSAEQNKVLKELQPVAKAMQALAQDNPVNLQKIDRSTWITRKSKEYLKGDTNRRKKVIDGMVEIIFEGKKLKEGRNNDPTTVKVINNMLGMASHSFFAFDVTSAMKNFLGAQWQIALEGAGNKYFSYRSWQRGRPWALKAMQEISSQVYTVGAKSQRVQTIEIFDAIQGRFEEKFGESPGRSFTKDLINGTWTTSHRKWLETEASLQLFSAIMKDQKVDQVQSDGTVKQLRYMEAWEIDPNTKKIVLKEGIDKTWDIGGKKFNEIKFKNHEVSNLLQGAYSQFDQPLVNRQMAFRVVASMKKYFTKMLLHRYGATGVGLNPKTWFHAKERYNLGTSGTHMGFYWQNMITLRKVVESKGAHLMYMTPDEVRAFKLGFLELFKLQLFVMAYMWYFGFDPDDPDKWKKLKKKSGALPTPFTDEKWSKNFDLGGWLDNQGLLLALHAQAEYQHFIPLPGYGLNDMYGVILGDLSISTMGSIGILKNLFSSMVFTMTGNDDVYYKSPQGAGALNVQQQGQNKFWIDLYKLGGLKARYVDPATAVKNFHNQKANYRR